MIFFSLVLLRFPPGSISSPGWRRGSVTPRVTTIPCPGCQHDIDLGERGISMLFRNFTLESIVERYRQAARAAVAIMCNICKPPQQQEATKSCMDCKASYCNECFKLHHPWGTPKAQHEYVGPTTNFRPKASTITTELEGYFFFFFFFLPKDLLKKTCLQSDYEHLSGDKLSQNKHESKINIGVFQFL